LTAFVFSFFKTLDTERHIFKIILIISACLVLIILKLGALANAFLIQHHKRRVRSQIDISSLSLNQLPIMTKMATRNFDVVIFGATGCSPLRFSIPQLCVDGNFSLKS
jgi:hypothetical protein